MNKGEWKVGEIIMLQPDFSLGFSITDETGLPIAIVSFRANANLIAAAPDGLEAGRAAYMALLRTPMWFRVTVQMELCQLRDFIAKATNQTSEDVQNEYESKLALAKAKG